MNSAGMFSESLKAGGLLAIINSRHQVMNSTAAINISKIG